MTELKNLKDAMKLKIKIQRFFGIFLCQNCGKKMDKESKEFAKEYNFDWCIKCLRENWD